jgi:hypothetical protein
MARREGVPFLGALPVDTELVSLLDAAEIPPEDSPLREAESPRGFGLAKRYQETQSGKLFEKVLDTLLNTLLAAERRISSTNHSTVVPHDS